tara:strand:+ start:176 stop:553 length:378 start_codon:yes stop_codon:yes gene_type:complete
MSYDESIKNILPYPTWGTSPCDVRGMNGSVPGKRKKQKEDAEFAITEEEKKEWKTEGWKEKSPKKKKKKTKRKKKLSLNDRWNRNFRGSLSGAIGTAKHMSSFTPEQIHLVKELVSIVENKQKKP